MWVLCDSAMTKDMLIVKFVRVEDLVKPFKLQPARSPLIKCPSQNDTETVHTSFAFLYLVWL